MNENEASEIRRAAVREKSPDVLRRWVLKLLEDRAEMRKEFDRLRPLERKGGSISLGTVNSTTGRDEAAEK
jgi:hypothetical protein